MLSLDNINNVELYVIPSLIISTLYIYFVNVNHPKQSLGDIL